MAASLTQTLIDTGFKNWLKGALAVLFAKHGLTGFVQNEVTDFQQDLLNDVWKLIGIPAGTTCNSCTTANVLVCPTPGFCSKGKNCKVHDSKISTLKPNQPCPHSMCTALRDAILKEHRYRGPSWKNTDARGWCTDAYQLAKCFMPPDGYADNASLPETDFNGVIAVIINHKRFEKKLSTNFANKANICEEIAFRTKTRLCRVSVWSELRTQIEQGKCALNSKLEIGKVELGAQTEQGKVELNSKIEKGKVELGAQTEHGKSELKSKVDKGVIDLIAQTEHNFGELNSKVEKGQGKLSAQTEQRKVELGFKVEKGKGELSAQTEQGKVELGLKVEKGKVELSAQTEQGKCELGLKVEKGKCELSAQTEQGKGELGLKVEKGKGELSAQTKNGMDEINAQIKKGANKLNVLTSEGYDQLSLHIAMGKTEVEAKTHQMKEKIETSGKQVLEEINRSTVLKTGNNDDTLLQDLKDDIITYYREHESVIPASPLVDEHNVPIEDLYVLPPVWAYKNCYFEQSKNKQKGDKTWWNVGPDKQEITISGLFVSGDVRYRKIYITANAGFGKTLLSQKLTLDWCQSHLPLTSRTDNYEDEGLAAMKYFDLLFLIHLRDYQIETKCNLDDLIMQMVSEKMSRNTQYTKEFVQRILHKKKCLIIFDGLDEWAHPGHCTRKPKVPHNNHPDSCTVLTTTRDWKIGTVGLSAKDIDRRVEISMLDAKSRYLLEENAIGILNERNLNLAGKNIADFKKEVKTVQIGDIINIPFILLQLLCLFFSGLPMGKSKCEIYSNITEFTLKRGLKKTNLPNINVQSNENAAVPNCMKQNKKCNLYFNPIMKLGKLAFCALFNEKKESSLIFDRKYAKLFMTKQEIEFCLKIGLLCQTKDSSIIAVKRYHVFFQHKSVQEFFSAIYITSEWQNESVKSTILKSCSSLSGVLEMSNVFVFVCGINPEVYTCISAELQKIVDLDSSINHYRTFMYIDEHDGPDYYKHWRAVQSYQSMQLECLQESLKNGNDSCPIPLYFVLDKHSLTYDVKALKSIIHVNESIGVSPQVSLNEKIVASMLSEYPPFVFMQSLDPGVFTTQVSLRVACRTEPVWLTDVLTESARTLKSLTLSLRPVSSLSDISITALTKQTCLQSLYLAAVHMTHSNLECLYAFISQTTTLTQLKLWDIRCSDHRYQYCDCDVTLDLHRLNVLKMLHLYWVPCRELHVNPACLEKLEFRPRVQKMTARASASLWQDLLAAPVLSSLMFYNMKSSCQEMIQTIPTLTQLKYLKLDHIDMGDVIPRLAPTVTQLERVELTSVTMSPAAWQQLFLSVGQLPRSITVKLEDITMTSQEWRELLLSVGELQNLVTVELYWCPDRGPSEEEWQTIVNVIKTTPTLSLLNDLSFYDWGCASLTLKNKTM